MRVSLAAPERPRAGEESKRALAVAVVAVAALLLGWLLRESIERRAASFNGLGGALSLAYPASWAEGKTEEGLLLSIYKPLSPGGIRPAFKVYARTLPQGQELMDAATTWTLGRMQDLREFRDLGTEESSLAGRPALKVNYGYIADQPAGSGWAALPVVVRASDIIVIQGTQYLVFSAASDAGLGELDPQFAPIMASIKLTGK